MDLYDLSNAFHKKLKLLNFSGQTLTEDEIINPKDASAIRRGVVILGKPEVVGFGHGVYSRANGFYQIDLFVQRETNFALKVLKRAATAHANHFFPANGRGLTLTENQTSAHIQRHPNILPFTREGAYLRHIVEVDFYIEIPAVG